MRNTGLILKSVAGALINSAVNRVIFEAIHKRARAIVNGFPGDQHIVGVHDAVDKAQTLPMTDQTSDVVDHSLKQPFIRISLSA